MKLFSILSLAVVSQSQTFATCTICADGITAGEDFVLPGSDDGENPPATCKMIVDQAKALSEGDNSCEGLKTYEGYCCPKVQENPCPFCPNGISVSGDFKPFDGDDVTCKDIVDVISTVDADSDMCKRIPDPNPCCPDTDRETSTPTSKPVTNNPTLQPMIKTTTKSPVSVSILMTEQPSSSAVPTALLYYADWSNGLNGLCKNDPQKRPTYTSLYQSVEACCDSS